MKVVSFNIRSASDPNGHSFDERAPRMKKVIDRIDPDLIGFQEVVPGWMKHIPEDYGKKYEIFHKYRCETFDIEGCTILWKKDLFECIEKGYFWLSDTPNIVSRGWDVIGCHRMVIWAKLREKKSGVEFHFFNTHYGFSDACQMKSAKLILDHFGPMKVRTFFITGDFNMFNHSPAYKYMSRTLRNMNELLENDLSPTFHGYCPERHQETPIDFCFITPKTVEPTGYKRITDTFDGKFPSDHFGLELDLEVKQTLDLYSLSAGSSVYEEDEKRRGHHAGATRHLVFYQDRDLVALRDVGKTLRESLKTKKSYTGVFADTASPIYYKPDILELQEAVELAENTGLAIFKHQNTGKVFGLLNADAKESEKLAVAEKIKAALAERAELPIVCAANMEMRIGDEAYRAIRSEMKDFRYELDPRNIAPTYKGNFADMADPSIRDFVFCRGESIIPVSYELGSTHHWGIQTSEHEGVTVAFTI